MIVSYTPIPFEQFFNPHVGVKVNSGTKGKVIFEWKVPKGYYAFLKGMTIQYYSGLRYIVELDGEKLPPFERQVGEIKEPYHYDPPYVFEHWIKIYVDNTSDKDLYAEILLEGFLVDKNELG